jgi:hypothetical protein
VSEVQVGLISKYGTHSAIMVRNGSVLLIMRRVGGMDEFVDNLMI